MIKTFRDAWQNRSWVRGVASATGIWGAFLFFVGTGLAFADVAPDVPVGTLASLMGGFMLVGYTLLIFTDLSRADVPQSGTYQALRDDTHL